MPILLITPPFTQTNTPYPAVPALAGYLRNNGVDAAQFDLSIAVSRSVMSAEGVRRIGAAMRLKRNAANRSALRFFTKQIAEYERLAGPALDFLGGKNPELAHLMARRGFFPEGPSFRELDPDPDESLELLFGSAGVADRAKHLASLFLDDIALCVRLALDPHFGFSKYAEQLCVAAPDFTPIYERLRSPEQSYVDELIDAFTAAECERRKPEIVGVTAPFPGTVYGAFKTAECVRRRFPHVKTVLGGGYVNTELREMNDPRVREFFDHVCYDEGFAKLSEICGKTPAPDSAKSHHYEVVKPDYAELSAPDAGRYFSLLETANPANRLWSDGKWLKLQLTRGCYWRKCAFCDTSLPYVRDYSAPAPAQAADTICELARETGIRAFHFTDEALPPALVSRLCDELIKRRLPLAWWGNIRFDAAFTPALAAKMRAAGCVAVTGGLECAADRLLALMNKGVTLAGARRVCAAFAQNGILVHAYLMYGFPTQTREEILSALDFIRRLYRDGFVQSSYWHRFALTAHSPIARNPGKFGIALLPEPAPASRFARNEIPYAEPAAPDWLRIGESLRIANGNFMRGAGLDVPAKQWLPRAGKGARAQRKNPGNG